MEIKAGRNSVINFPKWGLHEIHDFAAEGANLSFKSNFQYVNKADMPYYCDGICKMI